jgi:hypothetical protein
MNNANQNLPLLRPENSVGTDGEKPQGLAQPSTRTAVRVRAGLRPCDVPGLVHVALCQLPLCGETQEETMSGKTHQLERAWDIAFTNKCLALIDRNRAYWCTHMERLAELAKEDADMVVKALLALEEMEAK